MPWNVYFPSFRTYGSLFDVAAYSWDPKWKAYSLKLVVYDGLVWRWSLCHPVEERKVCNRSMNEISRLNWWAAEGQLDTIIRLTIHICMPQGMSLSLSHKSRSTNEENAVQAREVRWSWVLVCAERNERSTACLHNQLPFCISISRVKLAQTINCINADWTLSSVISHGKVKSCITHLCFSSVALSSGKTSKSS